MGAMDSEELVENGGIMVKESAPESGSSSEATKRLSRTSSVDDDDDYDDYVAIHDDVYNMFFLSNIFGQAFFYAAYVFSLKIALYTFLAIEAVERLQHKNKNQNVDSRVLAAQFLMLPVAVAMQDDLTATFYLIANIKYCPSVTRRNPDACKWKFHCANLARGIDGFYSLLVNFIILMKADNVLPMFLNFAALQFLQTVDNIALKLAEDGYLTERLEVVARNVKQARLPKKHSEFMRALDTVFFLATFIVLVIAWALINFVVN